MEKNNILTVSRMLSLLRCARQHYFQYEVGLRKKVEDSAPLRTGSAWHRAIESLALGKSFPKALDAAFPKDAGLNELEIATVTGLLIGYKSFWGKQRIVKKLHPEVRFSQVLTLTNFTVAGKIDGLGVLHDGRLALVESKTTSDSVAPDSNYWLRLRFNIQLYQYILAARAGGWDVHLAIYDVVHKPSIRPKKIKGEIETPDQFCDRLADDCKARPDFYFARREVAILESELVEFKSQRLQLANLIEHFRSKDSWPRNVSEMNCQWCPYTSFCLLNAKPTRDFSAQPFNPELETSEEKKL